MVTHMKLSIPAAILIPSFNSDAMFIDLVIPLHCLYNQFLIIPVIEGSRKDNSFFEIAAEFPDVFLFN